MAESSHFPAPSLVGTLTDTPTNQISLTRKIVLLLLFCFAGFLDAFNNAALVPAIPTLMRSMDITGSQPAWILSASQLTFASFLLISGRISDVYDTKNTFVIGFSLLGIFSVVAGFVNNKIALIILRALMGVASAMTVPSTLALLVRVFPQPLEQARAIAVLGGCGAIADVLGLFIGAVLVQYASYHWVFWFGAIVAIPVSLACLFAIPKEVAKAKDRPDNLKRGAKWQSLDPIGIFVLTVALILFTYAVISGPKDGWATTGILCPLIISIFLLIGFFYWETAIPVEKAAIPPRMWFYNNFSVLFGSALLPFFWWNTLFISFTTLWQDVFHWTIISTAIHMLPLGVATLMMSCSGSLSRVFSPKWLILTGLLMVAVSTALIAVARSRPEDYWRYVFPAFCLGSAGTMLTYTHTNIAIFQAAPASMAGTVGAIFNGALQFGSAIGVAVFFSIKSSVEADPQDDHGRMVASWFLLAIVLVEIFSVALFYQRETDHKPQPKFDDYNGNATVKATGDTGKSQGDV